jgi:hypothetical protein
LSERRQNFLAESGKLKAESGDFRAESGKLKAESGKNEFLWEKVESYSRLVGWSVKNLDGVKGFILNAIIF